MTPWPSPHSSGVVRRLGTLIETVHAMVYFAPEPQAAYAGLALRGFWRGYFASRSAALGKVSPELVTALFAGFAPSMVARAIPEVWRITSPSLVSAARQAAATAALHRILGPEAAERAGLIGSLTEICIRTLPLPGRPMAAAQSTLPRPADPLGALWYDCTVLREFRGDAHIAAVSAAGLTWPEPHLLQGSEVDPQQQQYRGWDDAAWQSAADRVRGLDLGTVEAMTDNLAAPAFQALQPAEVSRLLSALTPMAHAISATLPYPNAMALQRP
jgi:hypothetical protein